MIKLKSLLIERIDYHEIATQLVKDYGLRSKVKFGNIYAEEYPSKPEGYNWPRSYEQYKDNVEGLQEEMDAVYEVLDEYEEKIDDLEKTVTDLRIKLANKRDK